MKLTQIQKEIVMKEYPKLGNLVIYQIEKLKLDYGTFQDTMEVAYDIILQNAE
jgi:hypothetical protein